MYAQSADDSSRVVRCFGMRDSPAQLSEIGRCFLRRCRSGRVRSRSSRVVGRNVDGGRTGRSQAGERSLSLIAIAVFGTCAPIPCLNLFRLVRRRHPAPLQVPLDALIERIDPRASIGFPREDERIRRGDLERTRVIVVLVFVRSGRRYIARIRGRFGARDAGRRGRKWRRRGEAGSRIGSHRRGRCGGGSRGSRRTGPRLTRRRGWW